MTDPRNAGVPPAADAPPATKSPRKIPIVALFLAAFAIVLMVNAAAAWYVAHRIEQMAVRAVTRKEEAVDLGSLVTRIRDLNRLETASMRVVSVSTVRQTYDLIPNALAGDDLTRYYVRAVISRVGRSRLKPGAG